NPDEEGAMDRLDEVHRVEHRPECRPEEHPRHHAEPGLVLPAEVAHRLGIAAAGAAEEHGEGGGGWCHGRCTGESQAVGESSTSRFAAGRMEQSGLSRAFIPGVCYHT